MLKILKTSTNAVKKDNMHPADIAILAIYLLLIIGLGLFVWWVQKKKKQTNSTNNFFTGGGKNPVIVVGLSMWATVLSSLFFVNITGQVAKDAWMWVGPNIALIGITPFIAMWIIPFYRRIKETTAYAYLQKRFHYSLRAINSLSFIVFQIFRTSVVLFVPIVAIGAVVDFNPYVLIVVVGLVVMLLTAFGGFKAVIWTDAIQGLILLLGIVAVLIAALVNTNWNASTTEFQAILTKNSWAIKLSQGGIAFLFLYNIINSMYAFMASQDVTQRYKGTRTIYEIRRTLYISSALGILTVLLFFGAGSAMYTYYTSTGISGKGNILENIGVAQNAFLIVFVSKVMPIGFIGIILAAVFAASQSTISSGLSALSNSIVVDFIQPFAKNLSDKKLTWISKGIVLFFGTLSILFGIVLIYVKQDDLLNYFTGFVGLLNAPTVAVFVLGIFTKRANWIGTLIGIILGFVIGIPIWVMTQKFIPAEIKFDFNGVWLTFTTFFTTLIFGYVFSWILNLAGFKPDKKFLVNRTMLTRTPEFKQLTCLESELGKLQILVKKGKLERKYLEMVEQKIHHLEVVVDQQSL